mgnify:CR=1 FL=1
MNAAILWIAIASMLVMVMTGELMLMAILTAAWAVYFALAWGETRGR